MAARNRITVNLEDDEYEALQRISEVTDRSMAWLSRRAICEFIAQREAAEVPLLSALIDGARSDERSAR
jgi:predicted transcriptional regulator